MIILSCLRSRLKYSIDSFLILNTILKNGQKLRRKVCKLTQASTHVFTFLRPRNRPSTLPFFSFPLWWFTWVTKVSNTKSSKTLLIWRKNFTLTPSRESPSVEPMLTRLPCDNLSIEDFLQIQTILAPWQIKRQNVFLMKKARGNLDGQSARLIRCTSRHLQTPMLPF